MVDAVFAGPNVTVLSLVGIASLHTVIGGSNLVVEDTAFSGVLSGLALGDMNRDGRADVVAVQERALGVSYPSDRPIYDRESAVWTLLSDGLGRYRQAATAPTLVANPAGVSVADLDADRRLDVAVGGEHVLPTLDPLGPGAVSVLRGTGNGALYPPRLFRTIHTPAAQLIVDANSDHKPDIITGNTVGVTALINTSRRPVARLPLSIDLDLNSTLLVDLVGIQPGQTPLV
jgi:hypothetical protein